MHETQLLLAPLLLLASLLMLMGFRDVPGASAIVYDFAIAAVNYPRAPAAFVVFAVAGAHTVALLLLISLLPLMFAQVLTSIVPIYSSFLLCIAVGIVFSTEVTGVPAVSIVSSVTFLPHLMKNLLLL